MHRYENMTDEEFQSILTDIVATEGTDILSIPGVYEILSEHFNNEVLKTWEEKMYGQARIKMPDSEVIHEIGEDYDLEDDVDEDGLLFTFTTCGKELSGEIVYRQEVTCKACLKSGERRGS